MSLFSFTFGLFLAVVAVAYFLVPARYQWVLLLAASYLFYLCSGWQGLVYLLVTTCSTYGAALLLEKQQAACNTAIQAAQPPLDRQQKAVLKARCTRHKRLVLAGGLVLNFGILGVIKYTDFVLSNLNGLLAEPLPQVEFLLPLGISFYTFQSMGYLIDVYRGRAAAQHSLPRFALFVSYFPQMIQGPINRYGALSKELFAPHAWDYARVKSGLLRILWGYFKKLVVAERIAIPVNQIFDNFALEGYTGFTVFLGALLYSVQIYADFSGGMDIVFGVSEIFGIQMTENFRRPFMARSVAEFWQRWHITLGAWMREYLFYPLALSKPFGRMGKALRKRCGNYIGKVFPPCLASFIVFLIVGIWHGAGWRYIVYGVWQATFVSTATLLEGPYAAVRRKLHVNTACTSWKLFQMGRTVLIVALARYLSRAGSLTQALEMYAATFSEFNPWVLVDGTLFTLGLDAANFIVMLLAMAVLFAVDIANERGIVVRQAIARQDVLFRWTAYLAGIFVIVVFGVYGPGYNASAFIYAGF